MGALLQARRGKLAGILIVAALVGASLGAASSASAVEKAAVNTVLGTARSMGVEIAS